MSTDSKYPKTTIELTLTQEQLKILKKAAALRVITLNEYLLSAGLKVAEEPLPPSEEVVLDERDWEIFCSAMKNIPEPNEAIKVAIKQYIERYGEW